VKIAHGERQYELPDEWWQSAGMHDFVPATTSYRVDMTGWPGVSVVQLPVAEIGPVERCGSHGVFNDSPEFGSARSRVLRILQGFRKDDAIPPVEVLRAVGSQHAYDLAAGVHRLYCAIAAGFTHVPAVDVTTLHQSHDAGFDEFMRAARGRTKR
jgi:hypothetical protein